MIGRMLTSILCGVLCISAGMVYAAPPPVPTEAAIDSATSEVDRNFEQEAEEEMQHKPSTPLIKIDSPEEWAKERSEDEDGTVIETLSGSEVGEPYLE